MEPMNEDQKICVQCQQCCREAFVSTTYAAEPEMMNFFDKRGFTVSVAENRIFLGFKLDCPHLTATGCDIYEERPKLCREWDGRDYGYEKCRLPKKTSRSKVDLP